MSNFRVRFVTKVNLTDEHVHIDDVRITTATGQTCMDYRAVGSNDSLGPNLNATVTLAEFPAGHFESGTCP